MGGRRLLVLTTDGTTFEADPAYPQRARYKTPEGEWAAPENKEIHRKTALIHLATAVLARWEDHIHHQHPRTIRKRWNYQGEYVLAETVGRLGQGGSNDFGRQSFDPEA